MATERQIEANRRNARNSTGPRSSSGKSRASRNALSHGLTLPLSGAAAAQQVEILARQIAGDARGQFASELARTAAEAVLEIDRVRRTRVAMIERIFAFGRFEPPKVFATSRDELKWVTLHFLKMTYGKTPARMAVDSEPAMPEEEPQRSSEAIRRAIPELLRLHRYEVRAVNRRDRAIRALTQGARER